MYHYLCTCYYFLYISRQHMDIEKKDEKISTLKFTVRMLKYDSRK